MFEGLFQPMHMLVVFGIALLVFGPKKLPELGKASEKVSAASSPPCPPKKKLKTRLNQAPPKTSPKAEIAQLSRVGPELPYSAGDS